MQQREDIYIEAADIIIDTENKAFEHMYEEIILIRTGELKI